MTNFFSVIVWGCPSFDFPSVTKLLLLKIRLVLAASGNNQKILTKEVCKRISAAEEFPENILWITECEPATEVITVVKVFCKEHKQLSITNWILLSRIPNYLRLQIKEYK